MEKVYFNEIKKYRYKEFYERNFFIVTRYIFSLIKKIHKRKNFKNEYFFYANDILYVLENINNRRARFKNNDFYNFMQIYYSEYIDHNRLHSVIKTVINNIINHECYNIIDIATVLEFHYNMHKNLFSLPTK